MTQDWSFQVEIWDEIQKAATLDFQKISQVWDAQNWKKCMIRNDINWWRIEFVEVVKMVFVAQKFHHKLYWSKMAMILPKKVTKNTLKGI